MAIFLKFFGAAFLLFAVVTLGYSGVFYAQQHRILRDWPEAQATVIDSRVVEHATANGPLYATEIRFSFAAGGKPVVGEYVFPHESTSRERKEKQAAQYAAGSQHTVAYDPSEPSSVRVRPGYNVEFFVIPVFLTGVAAIFGVVGGGLLLLGSFARRRTRRATA